MTSRSGASSKRVAIAAFEFDDIGAGVREQLSRIRSGDAGGRLDDSKIPEALQIVPLIPRLTVS